MTTMLSVPAVNGFWVYEHLDANGVVLYVGQTTTPAFRLAAHTTRSPWFADVAEIRWHQCDTAERMGDVERQMVETLQPPHNKRLTGMTRRNKASGGRPKGHYIDKAAWEKWTRFKGTTLTEVAGVAGVSRSTLSAILGGHNGASVPMAHKIANGLGVHPAELFPTLRYSPEVAA